MGDTLKSIFTGKVMARLERRQNPTDALRFRLEVLGASGPLPSDETLASHVQTLRAWKAAWEAYTFTAKSCHLFDGPDGADLLARLTGHDDAGFRSAMAECMTCWYFAGYLKVAVGPWPTGRNGRQLDLKVAGSEAEILVEVKAPKRERPEGVSSGLADDLFAKRLEDANRKFTEGELNVLVLAPEVRPTVRELPVQLTQALYGPDMIVCPIDPRSGESLGPPRTEFKPDGKLLAMRKKVGSGQDASAGPALTRVGAVVCVEERLESRFPFPPWRLVFDDQRRKEADAAARRHFSPRNTFSVK